MVKRHIPLAILLASIALIARASAEEFPNRPITWVAPFAPGGITDTTSCIVAEEMARTLGQSERVRTHFEKVGTRPMTLQKAEMIPFIEKEIVRWRDVIERAGLEKQ
jgi:tripartite-type tricarboxylate transporter receptor subunit TctC